MTKELFRRMIQGAALTIHARHTDLAQLDSVGGDGDHGITMLRVMDALQLSFGPASPSGLHACLQEAGWNAMGVDGGASSSIVGAFFLGMGDAPENSDLPTIFESGLTAVQRHTEARAGDKTMMDALVPAVQAIRDASDEGKCEDEALRMAARAAQAGADCTTDMISRYGRARFAGQRTLGHADPGATSIALIFQGFCNGIDESRREGTHG